jgi:hypothetical protein
MCTEFSKRRTCGVKKKMRPRVEIQDGRQQREAEIFGSMILENTSESW